MSIPIEGRGCAPRVVVSFASLRNLGLMDLLSHPGRSGLRATILHNTNRRFNFDMGNWKSLGGGRMWEEIWVVQIDDPEVPDLNGYVLEGLPSHRTSFDALTILTPPVITLSV